MKHRLLISGIFLLAVLCSGCWNINEIDQRATAGGDGN